MSKLLSIFLIGLLLSACQTTQYSTGLWFFADDEYSDRQFGLISNELICLAFAGDILARREAKHRGLDCGVNI